MIINKLGVFDSGIGGLSVLKELLTLPIPKFAYFADTKNLPYGEKTPEQIKEFTLSAVRFLYERAAVDAVVLACHTASAVALEHVQANIPGLPVVGVVDPVVSAAVASTKNKRVGIIGTPATVRSGIHKAKILNLNPTIEVFPIACPKLVPLIEDGKRQTRQLKAAIWEYLAPLQDAGIDTLIIGCTHYELIKDDIREMAGADLKLISAPTETILHLKNSLHKKRAHSELIEESERENDSMPKSPLMYHSDCSYYVTSHPDRFMLNTQTMGLVHCRNQKPELTLLTP